MRVLDSQLGPQYCLSAVGLPQPFDLQGSYHPRTEVPSDQETLLAAKYASLVERSSGSRLGLLIPFVARQWPRACISSANWTWRVSQSYKYSRSQHINILELRPILLYFIYRSRRKRCVGTRFLHQVDSQVALSVAARCRTIFRCFQHIFSNILSEDNPCPQAKPMGWSRDRKRKIDAMVQFVGDSLNVGITNLRHVAPADNPRKPFPSQSPGIGTDFTRDHQQYWRFDLLECNPGSRNAAEEGNQQYSIVVWERRRIET